MTIRQLHGPRFELALARFEEQHPFQYEGIGFELASDGALECRVQSSWRAENVTEATAQQDLARAAAVLDTLMQGSRVFAAQVEHRRRRFLLLDEYGMGAIEICRKEGGHLKWAV